MHAVYHSTYLKFAFVPQIIFDLEICREYEINLFQTKKYLRVVPDNQVDIVAERCLTIYEKKSRNKYHFDCVYFVIFRVDLVHGKVYIYVTR